MVGTKLRTGGSLKRPLAMRRCLLRDDLAVAREPGYAAIVDALDDLDPVCPLEPTTATVTIAPTATLRGEVCATIDPAEPSSNVGTDGDAARIASTSGVTGA